MNVYKKIILLLAILAISAGCCTSVMPREVSQVNKKSAIVDQIQNAVVAFVIGPDGEKTPYCAGVWIDNEHILTAAHCAEITGRTLFSIDVEESYDAVGDLIVFINKKDLINDEIPQNLSWLGVVKKVDKYRDLALIRSISATSSHTIAPLALKDIEIGESIHIVGHPIGLFWSYINGDVSAIRHGDGPTLGKQQIKSKVIQVSAPIWVGNSGGGAFNYDGYLIGLCSWITLRAPNIGFFIHRDEIKDFLKSAD